MTPVVVVGGGPVGLAAALLVARWGIPVVVLEAAPGRTVVGSRSLCVQRDVLDIYHRIGVAAALVDEGVTWWTGRTYARDRELYTITFPQAGASAYPPFVNISQSRVEHHLEHEVAAHPLVDLRYGHEVATLRSAGDRVDLRVRTPAGSTDLTASHVIAADGGRSTVREALGLDFAGESYDDRFLIADIRASLPFTAERRFYFDPVWNPGRQVLVHPQADSVWRIDWQVPPDFDLDADRASGRLDERIRAITGDAPYDLVWASVYRFHQRLASSMAVGRVLLAGDAAHLMAPFGARGLNSGVQDAENAAWKIAYDVRGLAGPGLLASYDAERRAAAVENLRVTGETMRFLVPSTDTERAARAAALTAGDPAAVNSGKLAEPFWYVDSPLVTGAPPADFPTAAGATRPPVAGVLCPDGPVHTAAATRLRELFGLGETVLSVDRIPGVDAYRLGDLDPSGTLAAVLGAGPGWCAVVRPDGHLAGLPDRPTRADVAAVVARSRGH